MEWDEEILQAVHEKVVRWKKRLWNCECDDAFNKGKGVQRALQELYASSF